jgi:hypothetical protein
MKRAPSLALVIAICAGLVLSVPASNAARKLSVPAAANRAAAFAARTCKHDASCARHGVSNCRRKRARVILCRIFIRRRTEIQGHYRCTRLVRLSSVPGTRKAKVTGLGRWDC